SGSCRDTAGERPAPAEFAGRDGDEAVWTMGLTRSDRATDEARITLITRVGEQAGVGWREVDVDADPARADEYGDRVPVILVDGREHGYWRVEEARLRDALAGRRWSLR